MNFNFDWRLIGDDGVLMANVYMNLDSTHYALPLIFTFYVPFILSEGGRGGRGAGGGRRRGTRLFGRRPKGKKVPGFGREPGGIESVALAVPRSILFCCVCVCVSVGHAGVYASARNNGKMDRFIGN